jgi:hypothetical protein
MLVRFLDDQSIVGAVLLCCCWARSEMVVL